MITGLFMLSSAELSLCRDHEWRSGVTEDRGEAAPPTKVVFSGLPKPPHSNISPSHSKICPYFQTFAGREFTAMDTWICWKGGKHREEDCSPPIQLLVAEALR